MLCQEKKWNWHKLANTVLTCRTSTERTLDLITWSCLACVRTEIPPDSAWVIHHGTNKLPTRQITFFDGQTTVSATERDWSIDQSRTGVSSPRAAFLPTWLISCSVCPLPTWWRLCPRRRCHLGYNCRRKCLCSHRLINNGIEGRFRGWNWASNGLPGLLSFLSMVERVLPEWPE